MSVGLSRNASGSSRSAFSYYDEATGWHAATMVGHRAVVSQSNKPCPGRFSLWNSVNEASICGSPGQKSWGSRKGRPNCLPAVNLYQLAGSADHIIFRKRDEHIECSELRIKFALVEV